MTSASVVFDQSIIYIYVKLSDCAEMMTCCRDTVFSLSLFCYKVLWLQNKNYLLQSLLKHGQNVWVFYCLLQQRCPGAVFILASCLVIGVASVSLCQLHTRILDKYLPKTKSDVAAKPLTEDSSTLETIQNFQFRWGLLSLSMSMSVSTCIDLEYSLALYRQIATCSLGLVKMIGGWGGNVGKAWFMLTSNFQYFTTEDWLSKYQIQNQQSVIRTNCYITWPVLKNRNK